MNRPDKHTYFMSIAEQVATRSTCHRRQVGAVLVRNGHIVSTGYNGAPPGLSHCIDNDVCLILPPIANCIQTIHAELNSLLHVASHQVGDILYSTDQPCLVCIKAALSAGVERIYYKTPYPSDERDLFIRFNSLQDYLMQIVMPYKSYTQDIPLITERRFF